MRGAAESSGGAPRRLPVAAGLQGASRELRPGRGPATAGACALAGCSGRLARGVPCLAPAAPSSPVPDKVRPATPALTLRGLTRAAAGRGEARPGLRGETQRLVRAPSPPRLSPAASAAGSGSVTRAATALPPALPLPLSACLDLSRLRRPPSPPRPGAPSLAGVYSRRPGSTSLSFFARSAPWSPEVRGLLAGRRRGVEKHLTGVTASCWTFPV